VLLELMVNQEQLVFQEHLEVVEAREKEGRMELVVHLVRLVVLECQDCLELQELAVAREPVVLLER